MYVTNEFKNPWPPTSQFSAKLNNTNPPTSPLNQIRWGIGITQRTTRQIDIFL